MSMEDARTAKARLRAEVRARLAGVDAARWAEASAGVGTLLVEVLARMSARRVMVYAAMPGEVDVWGVWRWCVGRGVTVWLPRVRADGEMEAASAGDVGLSGLVRGRLGTLEPGPGAATIGAGEIDAVVVPGVAFDLGGGRLGRGKGFYDRFLGGVRGVPIGVCAEEQVVERVPMESWDVRMDAVVTDRRAVWVGDRGS